MKIISKSEQETIDLAISLSKRVEGDAVIALIGELGSGKTRFVQGLARGLGVPEGIFVRSPTFALVNEYKGGRLPIFHFDFYRLNSSEDLIDIGLDEYLESGGLCAIEWADRFLKWLPKRTVKIRFRAISEDEREIIISGGGDVSI